MPLRDHFRPPVSRMASWEGFQGGWPAVIVQQLRRLLSAGYVAEPRVRPGPRDGSDTPVIVTDDPPPARPSPDVETTLPDYDEYEVRVYDATRGRLLVAAVELVSPANKDRPEHRTVFVGKCAALLQKGVAVSVVDLVTVRQFNLYADLLAAIGHADPTLGDPPPPLYAAACRWTRDGKRAAFQAWSHGLAVGQSLPMLPLWLGRDRAVPLDLEASYEQACRDLWIA